MLIAKTKGFKMKKFVVSLLILLGLTGCDIAFPTYTLKINDKEKDTFVTKEECEKQAKTFNKMSKTFGSKKRATCHITFF